MGQRSTDTISSYVGDVAKDSDAKSYHVWTAPRAGRITSFGVGSTLAAVTAADTNYNTFALLNATTSMASLANGPASTGVTVPLNSVGAGTLSSTVASRAFTTGAVLKMEPTKTGSGLAVTGVFISFDVEYIG